MPWNFSELASLPFCRIPKSDFVRTPQPWAAGPYSFLENFMKTRIALMAAALFATTLAAHAQNYGPQRDPNGYYSQADQRGYYESQRPLSPDAGAQ